jgi:hypothetical protein
LREASKAGVWFARKEEIANRVLTIHEQTPVLSRGPEGVSCLAGPEAWQAISRHANSAFRTRDHEHGILLAGVAALAICLSTSAATMPSTSATTTYHRAEVQGVGIFYREAGPKDAPTIVLLHDYPSSSRMFDTLIPLLADRYHLIAPDYPGLGEISGQKRPSLHWTS